MQEKRLSSLDVLKRVQEIAEAGQLKGELDEKNLSFRLGVDLGKGRVQGVVVRDCTEDSVRPIVSFFSPCAVFQRKNLGNKLADMAMELLSANERMNFASFGVYESDEEILVAAGYELLLDEMSPLEFRAGVFSVAMAADMYEERFGKDEY